MKLPSKRTFDRRTFVTGLGTATAGVVTAGLAGGSISALAQTLAGSAPDVRALPKPNEYILSAAAQSMGTLITKIRSNGAEDADFRDVVRTYDTMRKELKQTGWSDALTARLKAADINNLPVQDWIITHSPRIRRAIPVLTESDIENAAWNAVRPETKAALAGRSFDDLQQEMLTHFSEFQAKARQDGIMKVNFARLKRTASGDCTALVVIGALLALAAIADPDADVVVLGIGALLLNMGDLLLIMSIGYQLAAAAQC